MIPKVIYNVWLGQHPMPEDRKKYIETWKKTNPDYKIVTITESNFDINKYAYIQSALQYKKWAFASDMLRLIVLYENGGFYLDTNDELIKPLSKLEHYKSVWALENSNAINSGLIIGAQKGDKNLKNIIDIYQNMIYTPGHDMDYVTVPIITNYFHSKGFHYKDRQQILSDKTVILPSTYFAPYHWWGGGKVSSKTMGIHHYQATWNDKFQIGWKDKIVHNGILLFPTIMLFLVRMKDYFKKKYKKML
ncbi:glycosyltransferase family 32 protein [Lactobacillus amylovorus]|uniref:glycosyltransferase family 32 protein n=1 Tax=Lactobacillus amylovorus TaxID=1604 RepID=UPI003F8BF08C